MRNMNFTILDFEIDDNNLWFTDASSGWLCRCNLLSNETEFVARLSHIDDKEQYRALHICNDKIYLPPLFAQDLIVFNIKTKELKQISLKGVVEENKPNYTKVIQYNNSLFCIPMSNTKILKINLIDDSYEVFEYQTAEDNKDVGRPVFRKADVKDNCIYMGFCNRTAVLKFDMNKFGFEEVPLAIRDVDGFASCNCLDSGIVLISYENTRAIVFDYSMELHKIFELENSVKFSNDLVHENKLYHIGCAGNGESTVINLQNGEASTVELKPHEQNGTHANEFPLNSFCMAGKIFKNEIWLFITKTRKIYRFSLEGEEVGEVSLVLKDDGGKMQEMMVNELRNEFAKNKGLIVYENDCMNIETFIKSIL